ncbi:F1C minor fimbrial subunit protein G precursor [Escherichia coli]|nr:F1C minor fimbrial subunit protein G precursor [Escherichia coli]
MKLKAIILATGLINCIVFSAQAVDTTITVTGNWICPYISRHLLSLNPSLAHCRRYSRGER